MAASINLLSEKIQKNCKEKPPMQVLLKESSQERILKMHQIYNEEWANQA